jgi:hypothetical protein
MEEGTHGIEETLAGKSGYPERQGFFRKHWDVMFVVALLLYLALLITGLIAEIFDIESILHWWIWSPPGSGW